MSQEPRGFWQPSFWALFHVHRCFCTRVVSTTFLVEGSECQFLFYMVCKYSSSFPECWLLCVLLAEGKFGQSGPASPCRQSFSQLITISLFLQTCYADSQHTNRPLQPQYHVPQQQQAQFRSFCVLQMHSRRVGLQGYDIHLSEPVREAFVACSASVESFSKFH